MFFALLIDSFFKMMMMCLPRYAGWPFFYALTLTSVQCSSRLIVMPRIRVSIEQTSSSHDKLPNMYKFFLFVISRIRVLLHKCTVGFFSSSFSSTFDESNEGANVFFSLLRMRNKMRRKKLTSLFTLNNFLYFFLVLLSILLTRHVSK